MSARAKETSIAPMAATTETTKRMATVAEMAASAYSSQKYARARLHARCAELATQPERVVVNR